MVASISWRSTAGDGENQPDVTLLRKLEIIGFKSFATPTTFVFDRGLTAIIGPNGSGKSNIAEALRWVLGEQSYSNLRGRRTEDVIFSGSDRRAAAGMAEVTLTIDNSDHELASEFSEVTVTRRASRAGENQYLINGQRVRLKDVQQLTAPLGQSHTIIGQGLVDAVLSQRPEDRRGLFEHAAGIAGLRMQATQAERQLVEADANAQRLRDILSELAPRVRSLARAARQAREYAEIRDELQTLQRRYFGSLWRDQLARRGNARRAVAQAEMRLESATGAHQEAVRALSIARTRVRDQQQRMDAAREQVSKIEREITSARHRIDLLQAEGRAIRQRIEDISALQASRTAERGHLQQTIARLDEEAESQRNAIERLEREHDDLEARNRTQALETQAIERRMREIDNEVLRLARQFAEAEGALTSIEERRQRSDDEQREHVARKRDLEEALAAAQHDHDEIAGQIDAPALDALREQLASERAQLERLERDQAGREDELQQLRRQITSLQARQEILDRSHEEGEGLFAGVKAIRRGISSGKLDMPGFIGAVVDVIDSPEQYQVAIEMALGGRLQDLIVRAWSDAEAGIRFLRESNRGRATFLPLETVRDRRPMTAPADPDVIGIASDLIGIPDGLELIARHLLGQTLIVTDLAATRRVLTEERRWTIVTLEGEITRPAGSVTGGSRNRASGLLARERERRSLPKEIARLQQQLDEATQAVEAGQAALATQRQGIAAAQRELRERTERFETATQQRDRQLARLDQLRQQSDRLERDAQALRERAVALEQQRGALTGQLRQLEQSRDALVQERDALVVRLEQQPASESARLTALASDLATQRERLRSAQREREQAEQRLASFATLHEQQSTEVEALNGQRDQVEAQLEEARVKLAGFEQQLSLARDALHPLAEERRNADEAVAEAETAADDGLARLRTAEQQRDQAALDLSRVQDEGTFLAERIRNDLEIDQPHSLLADAGEYSEEDEQKIRRLRDRLRRMSSVGEDVVEEYEEEAQRLAHLEAQLEDVDNAAASLRRVLADLHEQMSERFSSTFGDVALEFEQTFTRLFGGGAARLSLSDDETGAVDIVARPPGKRFQGLNQLSGGERALTAVALLVAIQRVNPSPFALLDEVDAALDESNVVRFRDEIRELTADTQFIVITHNRGTIEGADTLYGVSMAADGHSRVVSLRLEEAIRAVEEQAEGVISGAQSSS